MKEGLDGLKSMLFQDRRLIDEMQHSVARMKKYDDFFNDCNKKITHNEFDIKTIEKKL